MRTFLIFLAQILASACLAQSPVAIAPIVSESSGNLLGTAIAMPNGSYIGVLKSSKNILLGSSTESGWDFVASTQITPDGDDLNKAFKLLYPISPIEPKTLPKDAPTKGTFIWYFTDNEGSTLPTAQVEAVELQESVLQRLERFPLKLNDNPISQSGSLIFHDGQLIGISYRMRERVEYDAKTAPPIPNRHPSDPRQSSMRRPMTVYKDVMWLYPTSTLNDILESYPSSKLELDLISDWVKSIDWVDGEPTLQQPKKKISIELKPLTNTFGFELEADYSNNNTPTSSFPISLKKVDDLHYEGVVDVSDMVAKAMNLKVELTSDTTGRRLTGYTGYQAIPTTDGPVLLSNLTYPDRENNSKRYSRNYIKKPIDVLSEAQMLIEGDDSESPYNLKQFEHVKIYPVKSTIKASIQVRAVRGEEQHNYHHQAFTMTPGEGSIDLESVKKTIILDDWEYTQDIDNGRCITTGNRLYTVFVNKEGQMEILDRKSLNITGTINTSAIPKVGKQFALDNENIYILNPNQQEIVVYSLPQGQFNKIITPKQLGLQNNAAFIAIGASPLGQGDLVALVTMDNNHRNLTVRIDANKQSIIYQNEAFFTSNSINCVSPLFYDNSEPLFGPVPIKNRTRSSPLGKPQNNYSSSLSNIRGRGFNIPEAILYLKYPELYPIIRTDSSWLKILNQGKIAKEAAEAREDKPIEPYIFVDEPVYFRASPRSETVSLPVYSSSDKLELKILAGPAAYTLSETGQLVMAPRLKEDKRPDFILVQATIPEGKEALFWVGIDRF